MADMRYRPLGDSGLVVSVVGLGCNNFGWRTNLNRSRAVVESALEQGVTFFDTADVYGDSEDFLGRILKGRRDDVVIATKFGSDLHGALGEDYGARAARRYVRLAVERSLTRLRTEWIDLYQLHRTDEATPIDETLSVLTDLMHEGKIRYIGSSNLAGWQITDADWTARTRNLERFISAQARYNLLDRRAETEVIPAAAHSGIGIIPYYPLASGLLTGKYRRGEPPPDGSRLQGRTQELTEERFDRIEAIERYAEERGLSLLDVAIGGLAALPSVASVIAGATTPDQVRRNVAAGTWVPEASDLEALDALTSAARLS
jgi:aryl-alcohol dehydrogenase-like predicted oxidoreductase